MTRLANLIALRDAVQEGRIKGTYMPPEFFTAARAVQAVTRPKSDERKKA